ncbi:MAG: YcgN family cysteine cluster protein [Parvularculaceae bacterium]
MTGTPPFWETKSLDQMTPAEWESLCDGCGKCCLVLLEDEATGDIWETDVACKLFDCTTRRCLDYSNRSQLVTTCVNLSPQNVESLTWMPASCAYRLLANNQKLPNWHPLVTQNLKSTIEAGQATPVALKSEKKVSEKNLKHRCTRIRMPG